MVLFPKRLMVPALAIACFASSVSAAVIVETHAAAPGDDVLFSIQPPTLDKSYSWSRTAEGADLVQFGHSFTATSNAKMEKLTLRTGMLSSTNAAFTLNVYQVTSLTDGPLDGGSPIYTGTGNLPSAQGPRPGYMTFALDTPVELIKENIYLFTLSYTGDETGGSLGFFRGDGGPELEGSRFWYSTDGGGNYAQSSVLLNFYIQGSTIPEPSMAMLFIPGAAAAFYFRRR